MVKPGISYLVALVVLIGACQSRNENDKARTKAEDPGKAEDSKTARDMARTATPGEDPEMARRAANIAKYLATVPDPVIDVAGSAAGASLDNNAFRDRVIAFIRQVVAGGDRVTCELSLSSSRPFRTVVWIYQQGAETGRGEASDASLCVALKEATRRAIASGADRSALASARFAVHFPDHDYALGEFQGKGIEVSHGLVPVRTLDRALLQKRIEEGKAYLLRVIDEKRHGVHKYYHAPVDRFEDELHTIYTASTIFTLIRLHARDHDKRLLDLMKKAAEFLLSMQLRDEDDRGHGGFFYSFDLRADRPEPKLVVGTTSKTIFTLIDLHALTHDKKYMDAAELAASWLMTMQRPDGSVRSYLRRKDSGGWVASKKESTLYTGQVLSALSRMYGATKEPRYLEAATKTASYLAGKVAREGCYLGDQYRKPNPVSSSWLILSLFDFVKVTADKRFEELVFRCADELLGRQILDTRDVYRHGRWEGSLSSSGNGWLAEVMSELYLYCKAHGMKDCKRFEDAIVRVMRLLMQYTYSPENAFVARNPDAARGGVFWNVAERYVRTDAVCHAMNAYINMVDQLGDGPLVEIPEPPLAARLALAGTDANTAPGTPPATIGKPMDEERDDEAADESEEAADGPDEGAEEAAGPGAP